LPFQYADCARWQRQWLQGEELQKQLRYWKEHLAGAPQKLQLPTDHPRAAAQSYRGRDVVFSLDGDLSERLKDWCRERGVTLHMALFAVYGVMLSKLSGQAEVVIGTPVANRTREDLEGIIGLFVNTLALRLSLDGNPYVSDLLERVRLLTLDGYAHQAVPFEQVVEAINPVRSLSHSPIFQAMLVVQNHEQVFADLPGLEVRFQETPTQAAQFDLLMAVQETPEGLAGRLNYASDLFDHTTAARWVEHFHTLLADMIGGTDRRVSELNMLTVRDRQQILQSFNDTAVSFAAADRLIHELIEEQARQRPDAAAVRFEGQQINFAELNSRANQVAHWLLAQGIKPGDRVAICAVRSIEMMIGLVGILKSGAAYVPLDAEYPVNRLRYMLSDSVPAAVVTQSRLCERLQLRESKRPLLLLDSAEGLEQLDCQIDTNPDARAAGLTQRDLAYVIYTSGSTGQPKGVMNEHRAVMNRLLWAQSCCQLTPADRVMQKTPLSFDVSVWELFWPLMMGTCLVVARPGGHQDPDYLVKLIRQERITLMHFVPSMLQVFLVHPQVPECSSLRIVICSGEVLPAVAQSRFIQSLPNAQLHNLYGPTEAAVDVTWWNCSAEPREPVPIGRPIANTQIYVLGESGEPVPLGVGGEIHIGGVGVARGYLNREALTQERFIADPFSEQPGARLYKTGDVGRFLADGTIEYIGRLDHQVKVRGFRIELGEIESQLAKQPGVRDAVVIAREDRPGDKRLVGYVALEKGATNSSDELRRGLQEVLPDYMVPSAVVVLESLSMSANGKLDRAALMACGEEIVVEPSAYVPPVTNAQIAVARIWSELLRVESVGMADDFFQIGGNSLLAAQTIAHIREIFQLELPLRALFESPRLDQVVTRLEAIHGDPDVFEETAASFVQLMAMPDEQVAALLGESERPAVVQ
jgi:amino acid adenylation domain-containing protein